MKAERLRNSRKGKSGKFANCNWRISRSSANSAVVTDELAGRHYLLPALDVVLQASRMKKYHPCLRKHMMWRTSCCRKGGDSSFVRYSYYRLQFQYFRFQISDFSLLFGKFVDTDTEYSFCKTMADGRWQFRVQYSVFSFVLVLTVDS